MCDLVEHRVPEKCVEGHVVALVLGDELCGERHHDLIELGPHRVLELQPPCALGELDDLVVRKVDRDRLGSGVGITGVVDHIIGVQIRIRSWRFLLVFRWNGKPFLEHGKKGGITG